MTELLTAAQMRAIEEAAIASGQVTGLELMERAGRGVVEAIFEEWPDLQAAPHRAVVLCGPGNNGGDGFVVARLLREWGWDVEVFLYGDPERLPPDARANYERWCGMGVVTDYGAAVDSENPPYIGSADLVIDALFGIGLTRPIAASFDLMWPQGDLRGCPGVARVVAIDVPSGLCSDSGREIGEQVTLADLTVTFHRRKAGHFLAEGPSLCGRVRVVDLGLTQRRPWLRPVYRKLGSETTERGWILYPPGAIAPNSDPDCQLVGTQRYVGKQATAHKYSHGHALILSGPPGHTGAARLAARGALRIGAGLVTIGAAPPAIPEHAAQLTAIMLRDLPDGQALTKALGDARITALCLGPGLGLDQHAAGLVSAALAGGPPPPSPPHKGEGGRQGQGAGAAGGSLPLPLMGRGEGRGAPLPTVLDADALTLLARDPTLFGALHANCILTPHAGEFARLFPDIAERLAAPAATGPAWSKLDATRDAARRTGCVVLFKGPDTVIADPSGRAAISSAHYDRAAPWLATAGSGDVLAGFITGLLARGFGPFDAASTAAWLHVECALHFGPGLIAEDLPEELPKVFRALGL